MVSSSTVTDLAARALRRVGVAVVPASSRPPIADIADGASIVAQALRDLGINPVATAASDPTTSTVTISDLAAQALRAIGINPIAESDMGADAATISITEIAERALRGVGINPVSNADMAADTATITITEIAARALQAVGINPIAESVEGAYPSPRTPDYLAQNALKLLGVNPVEQASAPGLDGETFTQSQIGTFALQALGVYASDETPTTSDADLAATYVVAFHNHLVSLNLVRWLETAIPTEASVIYTMATAAKLGPSFGKAESQADYDKAVTDIRAIALSGQYAQSFALDHVAMVHNELVGLNLASWAETEIPDALSETYSKMAAIRMAPAFGQPVDQLSYSGQPADQAYQSCIITARLYALSGTAGQTIAEARATSVHESLAGRNLVSWASTSIPARVGDAYVTLTAGAMADLARAQIAPTDIARAEAAVAIMALSGSYGQGLAEARVTSVHERLAGQNLVAWPAAAIPAGAAEPYVILTMAALAPMMKVQADAAASQAAEATLRVMALSGAYGQSVAEEKVVDAHAALNGRNLVTWQSDAIPAGVADAYVAMATTQLAPLVGRQADPQAYAQSIDSIRLMVLSGAYATAFGEAALTNVHDALVAAAIVPWLQTAIPGSAAQSYAILVSANLAPTYNKAVDPALIKAARDQIADIVLVMGSQALAEQLLREIHAEWRDRDMTRWELFDIPRAAEESYIAATGIRLAPQFPGARSPDQMADAEARLYRLASLETTGHPVQVDYF